MIKILKKPGKSGNVLSTVMIGKTYISNWKKYIYKNWKMYCDKFDIGLIVIENFIDNTKARKKANWQKLLIGSKILESQISTKILNICYLDGDILINSYGAPNIFKSHVDKKISVVSQYKNLPFDYMETRKRISMFRHLFYSKKYPLDSAIFMSPKEIFKYHGFKQFDDYFCSGLFIFNLRMHSKFLENIYHKYDKNFKTLTGGDEPVINYEFQNFKKLNWLEYKYQCLWVYEMANKFPFLYGYGKINKRLQRECIASSLMSNYFLHFCGSWNESKMINMKDSYILNGKKQLIKKFYDYNKLIPKAASQGIIRP